MERHKIDVYPEPREKLARYINEPWLVDQSLLQDPVQDLSEEKRDGGAEYFLFHTIKELIKEYLSE